MGLSLRDRGLSHILQHTTSYHAAALWMMLQVKREEVTGRDSETAIPSIISQLPGGIPL